MLRRYTFKINLYSGLKKILFSKIFFETIASLHVLDRDRWITIARKIMKEESAKLVYSRAVAEKLRRFVSFVPVFLLCAPETFFSSFFFFSFTRVRCTRFFSLCDPFNRTSSRLSLHLPSLFCLQIARKLE